MTLERGLAFGLVALLCLGCGGGDDGAKKKSTGKKKKSGDGGAANAKVVTEVRDYWAAHELDWKGLQAKAAEAKKRVAKDKDAVDGIDGVLIQAKEFITGALTGKIDGIGKTAFDPANAQYWEKYLGQFDELEKQLAGFDDAVAAESAPKIAEWRMKILKLNFDKDVVEFARQNRTEVDKVLAQLASWRERVTKLGETGKDFLSQIDSIETSTKEITGWMQRTPSGPVDLLAPEHRGGWKKHGLVDFTFEGNELVLVGTGTDRKDFGLLLHDAFWWTDCEVDITFENVEKGFQLVLRAHPPRSGATQSLPAHVFKPDQPWTILMKIEGEAVWVGGDSEEKNSKFTGDPGGGIGLYVGPAAKAKIVKFEVRPAGSPRPERPPKRDPEAGEDESGEEKGGD